MDSAAGTTRDRLYGDAEWQGKRYTVVDTGGLAEDSAPLASEVAGQVREAIAEADRVLMVVDAQTGPSAADAPVVELLRKSAKPVTLVANKADNEELRGSVSGFWEYGLGEPVAVSAQHGRGTGDLLDVLVATLPSADLAPAVSKTPKVALLGRANVGKSTLFNRLAGQPKRITSDEPHTTRDTGSIKVSTPDGPLEVLDTAGIQRRGKSGRGIPKFSLLRTLRAVQEADVACLLIDGEEGPTTQDAHIASYVMEAGKAIVLVVNKWDVVEKTPDVQDQFLADLGESLGFLPHPPVVFVSALTGEKTARISRAVYDVYGLAGKRVETAELNKFVRSKLESLPGGAGRRSARLYYLTQVSTRPPTFLCFVNKADQWKENHRRHLENLLREEFGLLGTAITLRFRTKPPKEQPA